MSLVPQNQLVGPAFSSIAIIGPSKTGKTESIKTLHKFLVKHKLPTKIAHFDFDEDGAEPLIRVAKREGWLADLLVYRYNVKGVRVKNAVVPDRATGPFEDFMKDLNTFYDNLDMITNAWKPGTEIGAMGLDSMTALQDRVIDFVWALRHKDIDGTGDRAVSFNEWRMVQEKLVECVRSVKALPCYSYFCFHEDLRQEEITGPTPTSTVSTGKLFYVPMVTGQLAMKIAKEFSIVVHSTSEGGKYEWITRPDFQHRSVGSRGASELPARLPQDFDQLLAKP